LKRKISAAQILCYNKIKSILLFHKFILLFFWQKVASAPFSNVLFCKIEEKMKLKINVEVSKESYELSKGVGDLVLAIKACVQDGWQPGRDIPIIVSEIIGRLVPALQGVDKIKEEFAEDKGAAVLALTLPLVEVVNSLIS
jgi:hypothetical protein